MNVLNDAIAAMTASQDDTGGEQGRSSSLELGAMAAGEAAVEAVAQEYGAANEDQEEEEEDGDVVLADGVGNEVGSPSGENEVVEGAVQDLKEQPVAKLSRIGRPQRKKKVVEWVPSDEESEFAQVLADAANEDISDADDSFLDERDAKLARRRDKRRLKNEKEDRVARKTGAPRRMRGGRKNTNFGRLTRVLRDLPNEISSAIWSLCDVRTLLALSRSSREFYDFLHSKESSKSIWQSAWRVSGLDTPFLSHEWNEPMYAALLYGDACEICGKKTPACNFDFKIRVCKSCAYKSQAKRGYHQDPSVELGEGPEDEVGAAVRDLAISSRKLGKMAPFVGQEFTDEVIQCILSSYARICESKKYTWRDCSYYLQSSIEDVCAQVHQLVHQDIIDSMDRKRAGADELEIEGEELQDSLEEAWRTVPGRVGVYLRELRAESKRSIQDTTNLRSWAHEVHQQATEERRDAINRRRLAIVMRMAEEIEEIMGDDEYWLPLFLRAFDYRSPISHIVNVAYPLTDRAWEGCRDEVSETLFAFEKFPTLLAVNTYREENHGPLSRIDQGVVDHMKRMNRGY